MAEGGAWAPHPPEFRCRAVSRRGRRPRLTSPGRPLAVPPDLEHDAKKRLVRQISKTIGEVCGREVEEIHLPSGTKIYNNWVLTFFWELPLDKAALGDLIGVPGDLPRTAPGKGCEPP
jgi:hypothetical protein